MAKTPQADGVLEGKGLRLAIVTSQFNADITDRMQEVARAEIARHGAIATVDVRAPGTYDIPFLVDAALARGDVDAAVALGAVITGETRHDELVTFTAAAALTDIALKHGKPVGLGVTGPGQSHAQAAARIDRAAFAVRSAIEQVLALRAIRAPAAKPMRNR